MLQKLNERLQGVVAWVIIILVATTFTLFGLDYYFQSRHEPSIKAEVNGQDISKNDFELQLRRFSKFNESEDIDSKALNLTKQKVLQDMILNLVRVQAAIKNGFFIASDEVNSAILSIPQFQEDGHFSKNRFTHVLSNAFYTPDSFHNEVRQGMLINQERFALIGTEFALPREIESFVKLLLQSRDYAYVRVPSADFLNLATVTDKDVSDYYKKHKQQYVLSQKVSIEYLEVDMEEIAKNINLVKDQLVRYYEDNINNYQAPAQWRVAHIFLDTKSDDSKTKEQADKLFSTLQASPEKFNENMKLLSNDKISKDGILPWIVAGSTEYDEDFVNFTTPGQILPPIKSSKGYEIFKLVEYKPSRVKDFSEVQDLITKQVSTDITQAKYADLVEKLSDLSYQTPDSLDSVATALGIKVKYSDLFDKNGGSSDITKNKQVINQAFNHDVLELGNNSSLIQLDANKVIVLRVKDNISSKVAELSEVSNEIKSKILKEKAQKLALDFGNKIISKNLNLNPKVVNGDHEYVLNKVISAQRDYNTVEQEVNDLAFSLTLKNNKAGVFVNNSDYIIVELQKINDGNYNTLDKEQLFSITQQLESGYGLKDYNLYINEKLALAKVVVH
jgi:peptidyl-prolyl cis-trans isomerase D